MSRYAAFVCAGAPTPSIDDLCQSKKGSVSLISIDDETSLDELNALATTAGAIVLSRVLQKRQKPDTATFVGSKHKGLFGGIFATLGMVCPSLIIITIIAAALQNFAHYPAVQNAFAGIRVAVCVLILNSVVKLCKTSVKDTMTLLVFLVVGIGSVLLRGVSPVVFILCAGVLGVAVRVWLSRGKGGQA